MAEGAGLPQPTFPHVEEPSAPRLAGWTDHGPPSCFPSATLPIPARVSLRNTNQVLPILLKTSQGLPTELSIRGMLALSFKIPRMCPLPSRLQPLASSTSRMPPAPGPWLPPQGLCTCCSAACPSTFTGQVPSCHSVLDFSVTAREALAAPSKRTPQSVPTISLQRSY